MSSAQDSKQDTSVKGEDGQKSDNDARRPSPPRIEAPSDAVGDAKTSVASGTASTTAAPLAPPPKPAQNTSGDGPDYFGAAHGGSHFNLEPNPFEQSFGNPSAETPGKGLLPPVASLTSPSSLLPGGTPGWPNSLRSGPLSPAMLAGPTGGGDYFGEPWKGGFPTPNESSLRTGLTPGGGGSMFPAPSPNSQALFNSLQSGGATPSTSEFYRAAFKMNGGFNQGADPPTSQPTEQTSQPESTETKPFAAQQRPAQAQQAQQSDPFGQHDANVVTSLLGLSRADAQQNNNSNNQFNMSGPPPNSAAMAQMSNHLTSQAQESSALKRSKNSITSMSGSADTGDFSEDAHSEDAKPSKGRGKKNTNGKGQAAGNRRKADDGAVKQPSNKKAKTNDNVEPEVSSDEDNDKNDSGDGGKGKDGKKMTDEEKRRNFLERNRVAALKCRQRKKQWLANLQAKVELFSTENDALSAQITQLREEIVNLKTMLLAHKDCPVSQAQGISGMAMSNFIGDVNQHAHPYGMGMPPNGVPPMGMSMPQPPPPNSMRR